MLKEVTGFERIKQIEPVIQQLFDLSKSPGLSLGVIHEGEPVYTAHYGVRSTGDTLAPNDDTLYHLMSFTKLISACVVASLVDDGLLDWDMPVCQYLPQFRERKDELGQKATLVDLLANRSGLSAQLSFIGLMEHEWLVDKEDIVRVACDVEAVAKFREQFVYSTWGYGLITLLVEQASGKPFSVCVRERIFEPLGMHASTTDRPHSTNVASLHALSTTGEACLLAREGIWGDYCGFAAAAGASSSVKELSLMYRSMLHAYKHQTENDVDVTPGSPFKHLRRIFSPHIGVGRFSADKLAYCLGTYRAELPANISAPGFNSTLLGKNPKVLIGEQSAGLKVFHQNGTKPGANSSVILIPSTDSAVFVMANSLPQFDVSDYVSQVLLGTLLGEDKMPDYVSVARSLTKSYSLMFKAIDAVLKKGKTGQPPELPLEKYEGDYYNKGGSFSFSIRVRRGKLELSRQGRPLTRLVLEPYGGNNFYWRPDHDWEICKMGMWPFLPPRTRIIRFINENGEVKTFKFHHDHSSPAPATFVKRKPHAIARI